MENSSSGSFIPKRSTGKVVQRRTGKRIYVFSYIAYALFFGTLFSVAGIFLLTQQAESKLGSLIGQLTEAQSAFDQADMKYVISLSTQLRTAEFLVDNHLAPSKLFDELERIIVQPVQLNGLEYQKGNETVEVTFEGSSKTFDALVFQRTIMEKSDIFSASQISDVVYGSESIEAVGDSARSEIAAVTTEAKISFIFGDEEIRDRIGYTVRNPFEVSEPVTETVASSTIDVSS